MTTTTATPHDNTESLAAWLRRNNVSEDRITYYLTTELETRYYPTLHTRITTDKRVPRERPLEDYT